MSLTLEEVVHRLAARQHGVVTRRQLRSEGFDGAVVDQRVRTRRLRPIHRGVYLVGPVAPPNAPEMAACLACGPRAVLSHRTAGVHWKILKARTGPRSVEVTIPGGYRRRPGIRVYRIRTLQPGETTRLMGIPVTTPVRTLFDLAGHLRRRPLERAVAEAIARRLTSPEEVLAMSRRHARRRGAARLRATVEAGDPARTRSEAEERFLTLVRRARLDPPEVNVTLGRYEVDFYWPRSRLAVEMDGMSFHTSRRAFERDRLRDGELAARGVRVVRVTWRQLSREPEALLVRLGRALSGASGQPD